METLHETCLEYFRRRLSEGWKCISLEGYNAVLLSPEGIRRELDLRNDVETLRPNGVGSETNIGAEYPGGEAHWSLVDELIADDDDTYVYNTASPQRDLYALPAHAAEGTINKVTVYMRTYTGSAFRYLGRVKTAIYTHTTVYEGDEEHPVVEYTLFSTEYITNPNTGAAWTWDEIDALEAGVTLCGTGWGSRCTQVYVEVDYTFVPPVALTVPEYQRRVLMQKQPDGSYKEVSESYPLEVHDPKVGSLISYDGTTTTDGAGDGSTLIDSVLATKPDYNGNLVIITSGDYAGQARDINAVTTGGTVTPASNFGGKIVSGVTFVIVGIRTVPAEVAALQADVGDASASTLGSLYAILGNPTYTFLAMLGAFTSTENLKAILGDLSTTKRLGQILGGLDETNTLKAILGAFTTTQNLKAILGNLSTTKNLGGILGALTTTDNLKGILGAYTTAANLKAAIDALALEATLGTHDTDIKNLLATIAGYIDTEVAAILAAVDTEVAAIKAQTDKIAGKMLFSMDFWSDPVEEVPVGDGVAGATEALGTVTIEDLPTNATIVRAIAMFKFRMIENTNAAANKLNGATDPGTSQVIQVADDTPGTYYDAINFVDDQFGIAAETREGGDVLIGSIDISGVGKVDANDGYLFRWLLARADLDFLNFNDVACGIRIYYSL